MATETVREAILRLGLRRKSEGAVLFASNGGTLDWLLDLRPIFLQKHWLEQIAGAFWERYRGHASFQLGGMETAAIPLLTALLMCAPGERGSVNGFIIRKARKTTGMGNVIEGSVTDEPIVLVDDILNSGTSAEKARVALQMYGHRLREVFAVVDYRSKRGLAWREAHEIAAQSLFTLDDFTLRLRPERPAPPQRYRQLWHTTVPDANPYYVVPKSTPLLRGDRIYRGCDSGKMQAFDARTGAIVWEYQATGVSQRKGIWSSPALHDGRLYFGAYNGTVYCLDAADGREIWAQAYGEWVGASPLIVPRHGLAYFGLEYERPWARGSIAALDVETGEKVWEHQTRKLQHGSPAYWSGGDKVIWGTADHEMTALDAATGAVSWIFPTRRSVKYSPAVDEQRGLVACASFDKSIYILDAASGMLRGEWQTGEICYTTPLFCGNRLFCGSGDHHLYVIDLDRMELVRKLDLGARVYSSPRRLGTRVVIGTGGGKVVEIDCESLEVLGELQVPDAITNAVAADPDGRRIYVSTYMNHLYAFERLEVEPRAARFIRISSQVSIQEIRREILSQPDLWGLNTNRQQQIAVQRETESVFLRSAKRSENSSASINDVHESEKTRLAARFPATMRWVETFARQQGCELGRVLLAKLGPRGQVYRHIDHGEYYKVHDRYHLVLLSTRGSQMTCDDEVRIMREGELWWFDNKQAHESHNPSDEDRIHLIFDLSARANVYFKSQTQDVAL